MGIPSCGKHCRGLSLYLAAYKEDSESGQTRWILTAEFQTQHQAGHLFHCKTTIIRAMNKTFVSLRGRYMASQLFAVFLFFFFGFWLRSRSHEDKQKNSEMQRILGFHSRCKQRPECVTSFTPLCAQNSPIYTMP